MSVRRCTSHIAVIFPIVFQALLLFLAAASLAVTESKEKRKADKRGVLANVGNDGKIVGGRSGDSDGDRSVYGGGRHIDALAQG
jgi:hypothetical protein